MVNNKQMTLKSLIVKFENFKQSRLTVFLVAKCFLHGHCSSENCKHFCSAVQLCYFLQYSFSSLLVRSAQTVRVVYTLCAELVFWC